MIVPSGVGFGGPQRRGCADLTEPRREKARSAEAPENYDSQDLAAAALGPEDGIR
jgi:hypothetical protein